MLKLTQLLVERYGISWTFSTRQTELSSPSSKGVTWFELEEQGLEPDIHAKNLVLKMSPAEPGGPASVLPALNRGSTVTQEIIDPTPSSGGGPALRDDDGDV